MKLSFSQISSFLARPPAAMRVFLFYGPDSGLAHDRAASLIAKLLPDKNDPFAVVSLSGAALGGEEARLADEAASMILGGGRRLIHVHQAIEANAKPLARFLDTPPPGDSAIVIEAGDLDKRSKLRSLCEGASEIAAGIPCYLEDSAARQRAIGDMLSAEKLRASRDVLRFLDESLPPDRMALRSEIEKLALYAQGRGEVTMEDASAVLSNAGGAEIDDWIQAMAGGETQKAQTLLDHLFAEQTSPVQLLRAAQRHLLRLRLARAYMDQGDNASVALKKLSPPVFWKLEEPMRRQLARWSAERLEARLAQLLEAEAAVKRTGAPDIALCAQLFLSLAAKA